MKKQGQSLTDHPYYGYCRQGKKKGRFRPDNPIFDEEKEIHLLDERGGSSQNKGKEFRQRIIKLVMVRPGLGSLPKINFL